MRNEQVKVGVSRRIIYAPVEVPVRLEKLRVKFDVALDVDRTSRRSELGNLRKSCADAGKFIRAAGPNRELKNLISR